MRLIQLILLFAFTNGFCVDFGLAIGTEGGLRSDSYENNAAATQTVFFISPYVTPSAEMALRKGLSLNLEGTASGNFYTEGSNEHTFEAQAAFTHSGGKKDLRFILAGGYYVQPSSLDPDQPSDYSQYGFTLERRGKETRPLRLSYTLSLLSDPEAPRTDWKHKIKAKKSFKPFPWLLPGVGMGLGMNFSDEDGYAYTEADFPLSATFLINNRNSLTTMLYLNMRWYEAVEASPTGADAAKMAKGKPGKTGQGTGSAVESDNPSSHTTSILVSYTRELLERIDFELNCDLSLYDSDFGVNYSSSRIYAGLEWRIGQE